MIDVSLFISLHLSLYVSLHRSLLSFSLSFSVSLSFALSLSLSLGVCLGALSAHGRGGMSQVLGLLSRLCRAGSCSVRASSGLFLRTAQSSPACHFAFVAVVGPCGVSWRSVCCGWPRRRCREACAANHGLQWLPTPLLRARRRGVLAGAILCGARKSEGWAGREGTLRSCGALLVERRRLDIGVIRPLRMSHNRPSQCGVWQPGALRHRAGRPRFAFVLEEAVCDP